VSCQGSDWYRVHKDEAGEEARKWRAKRPSNAPVQLAGGRVVYGGTELRLESFTVALNQKATMKGDVHAPNWNAGFDLVRGTPTGTLVAKASATTVGMMEDHLSTISPYAATAQNAFMIQCGTRASNPGIFAFIAPVIQLTNYKVDKAEGVCSVTMDFQVVDHDTDTTGLPPWAVTL
jgi:hypothetical protein